MLAIYTLGIGIGPTLQYSVLTNISHDTGISDNDLVQGTGVMFLLLGWGALVWQPLAHAYGRRGVYLLSALLVVPLMEWTAYSNTAGQWFGHRVLIGLAGAPIEFLPELSIVDVWFAHERGTFTGIYMFVLFGSNFVAPLIAGFFNDAYGWRWTMHLGAIIAAGAFAILFFFLEETLFIRDNIHEGIDGKVKEDNILACENVIEKGDKSGTDLEASPNFPAAPTSVSPTALIPVPRPTLWQRFRPFVLLPNRPPLREVFAMMVRPLYLLFKFPWTAWSGFQYGINLSWYSVLNGTASPVLSAPPYSWPASFVGLSYVGPIIGAFFSAIWSGPIADWWALALAKRRGGGVREPEERLWPFLGTGLIAAAGLVTWGIGAAHAVAWPGLVFGLGMLTFGCVGSGALAVAYNVDCGREIGGETMAAVVVVRNTIGFAINYAVTPWYTNMGLQNCFVTAAMVSVACTVTVGPVLVWGKQVRRWSAARYWRYVEARGHHV